MGLLASHRSPEYSGRMIRRVAMRRGSRLLAQVALAALAITSASAQTPAPNAGTPTPGPPPAAAPLTALVEDLLGQFPKADGDILEARDGVLTLSAGRRNGMRTGLDVELYREGREIKHPRTGETLGKSEDALGRARITDVQEA